MGDLIQTIGLINRINNLYPDALIDVLVMKGFSPILKHNENINKIFSLDHEILNPNLVDDVWAGFNELYEVIHCLNKNKYDFLFNPIVSQQSALLAFLIEAKRKLGLQRTKNNEQKMTCDFIAYQLANEHKLGDFSFNLVDIMSGMTLDLDRHASNISKKTQNIPLNKEADFKKNGYITPSFLSLKVFDEDIETIKAFIHKIKSKNKKILGFHIGASQSNKAWNIKYYYKVINDLLEKGDFCIVLFGGSKEKEYKPFFEAINNDLFFNMIGDFKLNELIAAISYIDLMVTNDTGPMHIAVSLNKPIIDISLGPVSKWETGPYTEKSIIIQARLDCHPCNFDFKCPHWNCHHVITPDVVVEVVNSYIKNESSILNKNLFDKAILFKTYFDQFGFHAVRPMNKENITKIEYIFHIKRFIWSLYICEKLKTPDVYFQNFMNFLNEDYIIPDYSFTDLKNFISDLINIISNIIKNLDLICKNLKNVDKNHKYFYEVKKEKDLLLNKAKDFELIYDWFSFLLFKESDIEEVEISKIVKKTISLYDILKMKLILFKDLLP